MRRAAPTSAKLRPALGVNQSGHRQEGGVSHDDDDMTDISKFTSFPKGAPRGQGHPVSIGHHPLVEQFFSGRRSSAGLAWITFTTTPTRSLTRHRCATEGCRNLALGRGRHAHLCRVHSRLLARQRHRERQRAYRQRREAAPPPGVTLMPSGVLREPSNHAASGGTKSATGVTPVSLPSPSNSRGISVTLPGEESLP